VALVRTDVSEERSASIIRVARISELGTMLAITSNNAHCEEILREKGSVSMEYQIKNAERSGGSRHPACLIWYSILICPFSLSISLQDASVASYG
jgi:hypothetical protein